MQAGEWKDKHVLIEVVPHKLTYAEILWAVHAMAFANLEDQDHHYFEGFEPLAQEVQSGRSCLRSDLGQLMQEAGRNHQAVFVATA